MNHREVPLERIRTDLILQLGCHVLLHLRVHGFQLIQDDVLGFGEWIFFVWNRIVSPIRKSSQQCAENRFLRYQNLVWLSDFQLFILRFWGQIWFSPSFIHKISRYWCICCIHAARFCHWWLRTEVHCHQYRNLCQFLLRGCRREWYHAESKNVQRWIFLMLLWLLPG